MKPTCLFTSQQIAFHISQWPTEAKEAMKITLVFLLSVQELGIALGWNLVPTATNHRANQGRDMLLGVLAK